MHGLSGFTDVEIFLEKIMHIAVLFCLTGFRAFGIGRSLIAKIRFMEDVFELPVDYNGEELTFASRLVRFGYSYQIEVQINGAPVCFEKDEEGNWRALTNPNTRSTKVNIDILNKIVEALDNL